MINLVVMFINKSMILVIKIKYFNLNLKILKIKLINQYNHFFLNITKKRIILSIELKKQLIFLKIVTHKNNKIKLNNIFKINLLIILKF